MAERVKTIGEKAVKTASHAVSFAALAAVLLMAAYGGAALWDANQSYQEAAGAQYEAYKPGAEDTGQSFETLVALNPEVFSWLTVYGTNIDYPVAQGDNNTKYVNTSAQGSYSLSGSIFLDYRNESDFSDFNSILYGHNMENQVMFGELAQFADQSYFDARLYGNLYYNGTNYGLEFFAFLNADGYDASVYTAGVSGAEAQQAYLDNLLQMATVTRDIGVTAQDRIVLLSTCATEGTNVRDILVARITDTVYDDPFAQGTGGAAAAGTNGLWAAVRPWLWVVPPALIVLPLAGVIIRGKIRARRCVKNKPKSGHKE